MIMTPKHVALIICDNRFIQEADGVDEYLKKLTRFIHTKEEGKEIEIMTLSGRYGVGGDFPVFEVDDKNKSGFAIAIVDRLNYFDEIIFICNYKKEPFIYHLKTKLQEQEIPMSMFNYRTSPTTRDDEES